MRCLEHAWMDLCHTNTILTDQLIPPKSDKFRYFADGWKEAPRHYLPASSSSWQSAEGIPGSNSCPDPRHPGSLHTHQHHSNKHQCATQHTCSSSNTFSKLLLSPGDNWEWMGDSCLCEWIVIWTGFTQKILSKFTNFSQAFAIWCRKATQSYATLPHIQWRDVTLL